MEGLLPPATFYDDLADEYHLLFEDWWDSALEHGEIIDRLLLSLGVRRGGRVLDCTCGIGTQAIPLALRRYQVFGSDISTAAIERAKREANKRHAAIDFAVCDVRDVGRVVSSRFDAALACDNSLPHLLTDGDLLAALRSIKTCLSPRGVLVASIRDYDELSRQRPTGVMPVTYSSGPSTRVIGQAWEWSERAETVIIRLFVLQEQEGRWSCRFEPLGIVRCGELTWTRL
ncbi:MAG: class I SAM-dependent DNA methyltransferase [Gaiellaceae bacterium]